MSGAEQVAHAQTAGTRHECEFFCVFLIRGRVGWKGNAKE